MKADSWETSGTHTEVLLETLCDGSRLRGRDAVLQLVCEKVVDLVGAPMAAIRLPDADDASLTVVALHGDDLLPERHARSMRAERIDLATLSSSHVQPGPRSPSAESFLTGTIQVVPRLTDQGDDFPMQSMTVVPLIRSGRTTGVLAVYWLEPHHPGEDGLRLLRTVARLVSFLMHAAQLVDVTNEHARVAASLASRESAARTEAEAVAGFLTAASHLDRGRGSESVPAVADLLSATIRGWVEVRTSAGPLVSAGSRTEADAVTELPLASRPPATLRWQSTHPLGEVVGRAAAAWLVPLLERANEHGYVDHIVAAAALARLCDPDAPDPGPADAATVLGLTPWRQIELVVARFPHRQAAYLGLKLLRRDRVGAGIIAATDVGRSLVVLGEARHRATAQLSTIDGVAGIGTSGTFAGWRRIPEQLRAADEAAQASRGPGQPVCADDLDPLARLALAVPGANLESLATEILDPLFRYDAEQGTDLLGTLRAYLAGNGSVSRVATRLHVHPNTVKQRVDRIEKVLGVDLRDYRTVAGVSLALDWLGPDR